MLPRRGSVLIGTADLAEPPHPRVQSLEQSRRSSATGQRWAGVRSVWTRSAEESLIKD